MADYFSTKDIAQKVGCTSNQVRYWFRKGYFTPDAETVGGIHLYRIETVKQIAKHWPKWVRKPKPNGGRVDK